MSTGNAQITPENLTNEQFLRILFEDQWKRALIAGFRGDPRKATEADWRAYPATMLPGEDVQNRLNMYLCPSLVHGTRRAIARFISFHVLVVDDYGTKVAAGRPESLLGPMTYLIETSPGNFQAGWKTTNITDLAWLKGMLVRLRAAIGGGDNLTDPVAWRRLPVGINGKYAPPGWRVDMAPGVRS